VRPFQSVLLDLGARLQLPGFIDEDGTATYRDYADYMVRHERKAGIGPLAGWRGAGGSKSGRGEPNPDQLSRYIANGSFWKETIPPEARFFKHANAAYQDWAVAMGLADEPQPVVFQLYSEPLRRFQLAAEGHGDRQPPEHLRERIRRCFDPLPAWYPPFEGEALAGRGADFPLHAITQRPMAMYHSWGSQNAWLRQIHGQNPLYVPGPVCDEHELADGDWVWVISHFARIKVPIARMEAVNARTLWTWNAIGKRRGAWALAPDAPETTKGFLINHLIHELLPPKGDGLRWANSDPVTGQAAWYDLRVRIEKAEAGQVLAEPQLSPQADPAGHSPRPAELRYGQEWTP
jgi:sulfite dehydrogenase (quinone) subunit SoeA